MRRKLHARVAVVEEAAIQAAIEGMTDAEILTELAGIAAQVPPEDVERLLALPVPSEKGVSAWTDDEIRAAALQTAAAYPAKGATCDR